MTGRVEASREFIDRQDIFDLVRRERFARDQQQFDVMSECFHENAWVRTTWYDGIGGRSYVDSTREFLRMLGEGRGGKHWVFPAFAKICGDRATIESPAKIAARHDEIGGIEADIHSYCRFYSRVVREGGQWRLLSFHVLFEWDELHPVTPGQVPRLDHELLASFRPSYRYLGYAQAMRGVKVNPDLLGDDRWDELTAFHMREDGWLEGDGATNSPR